jgi:hypothetical protein
MPNRRAKPWASNPDGVFEQARSTAQSTLDRVIQDQPLLVAVAGLAAGAAVAAAFPATEIEKQTLGPVGEQVSEAAERVGEQLKEATGKAGEKLKDAAEQRGLNAEGMKEVAKEVAEAFTGSMGGSSQQGGSMGGSSQQGGSMSGSSSQESGASAGAKRRPTPRTP